MGVRRVGKKWRAEICVVGVRASRVCATKSEAEAWAVDRSREIRALGNGASITHTVRDVFDRYAREVSPQKRGARWEQIRLTYLGNDPIAGLRLADISAADMAAWRDRRLVEVSSSTVCRDLNLISHAFALARDEWRWMVASPLDGVRRPKQAPPRDRLIADDEIDRIVIAGGYVPGAPIVRISQRVVGAFLFAIETAMRAGEICSLGPGDVRGRVAHLEQTKNGYSRDVPLSSRALELLSEFGGCFELTPAQLDANFRKLRKMAGIEGITFHDTRHLAVTRLSKKLDVLALARMTGHRDLRMLQRYYNEGAEELAARLG